MSIMCQKFSTVAGLRWFEGGLTLVLSLFYLGPCLSGSLAQDVHVSLNLYGNVILLTNNSLDCCYCM